MVRDRKRVATCLGFGPRFLHSTGQAYKGGPNTGVFLQITCDDAARSGGSGPKIHLRHREGRGGARRFRRCWPSAARRVLRVHLGAHVAAGLATLKAAIREALREREPIRR